MAEATDAPKPALYGGTPQTPEQEALIEKAPNPEDGSAEVAARVKSPTSFDPDIDPEVSTRNLIPQDPYRTSPLFYEIANYFGIDSKEYDGAVDKLSLIVDWAVQESKSNKVEDLMLKLRKLENRLSPPTWGEKRWKNVFRYVRLAQQQSAFTKAMKAFEKEGD